MRARISSCTMAIVAVLGCKPTDAVDVAGGDHSGVGDSRTGDDDGASFYEQLTFGETVVEMADPDHRPGYQGRLLRAADGTLYHASLKYMGSYVQDELGNSCDIADFAGGPAPASQYHVRVGVRAPGASVWAVETAPLDQVSVGGNKPFVGALWGLDAVVDGGGRLVLAFAAGRPGVATCASSDLVVATRETTGAWSFAVPVQQDSAACCGVPDCPDYSACTQGTDVGAWAALAVTPDGGLAAAFVDFHFYWDQDGQTHQGYELWEASGVSAIRPWSGLGAFGALRWAGGVPLSVFTAFEGGGLFVLRRTGGGRSAADWQEQNLRPGWIISERISIAQSEVDGTIGIAVHAAFDDQDARVDDLVYCFSMDDGATWSLPCENVDSRTLSLGQHPALAFDPEGRAVVTYYYCGGDYPCRASEDGLKLAWRRGPGDWRTRTLHGSAASMSGTYSGIAFDPETGLPTIVFQDVTNSAVIALQARDTGE